MGYKLVLAWALPKQVEQDRDPRLPLSSHQGLHCLNAGFVVQNIGPVLFHQRCEGGQLVQLVQLGGVEEVRVDPFQNLPQVVPSQYIVHRIQGGSQVELSEQAQDHLVLSLQKLLAHPIKCWQQYLLSGYNQSNRQMATPTHSFFRNFKEELDDITQLAKRSPSKSSKECVQSIKRMSKMVNDSSIRFPDKKQVILKLERLSRSVSPKKSLSSTRYKSDKTVKILKSHKHRPNKNSNSTQNSQQSHRVKELILRNTMLQEQVRLYKRRVRQARDQLLADLKGNDSIEDKTLEAELADSKRVINQLKKQLKSSQSNLEERAHDMDQLRHENQTLRKSLCRREQQIVRMQQSAQFKQETIVKLNKQLQRHKLQSQAFQNKKDSLYTNNQRLKDIVKKYKTYL